MPLLSGSSADIVSANIAELIRAGHAPDQAAAIAIKRASGEDSAAGILYRAGPSVLMLLRGSGGDQPFTWAFPGGKIEEGETPEQAAIRESTEEIGVTPEQALRLVDWNEGFTTYAVDVPEPFVPALNGEHLGYAWVPLPCTLQPMHPGCALTLARAPLEAPGTGLDERLVDGNGWFEVKGNPLSKVGVFPYLGSQLGKTGADASRVYQVLRPEEELSDPACVESFKLIPWVDEHTLVGPAMMEISDKATTAEQKGVHGVVGEDVYYEEGILRGNIKAFSSTLAALIEAGKRELSAGYRCVYDWTAGMWNGVQYDVVQRKIRGNHLASVKRGRMGPDVAVMDSFDFDPQEAGKMADDTKKDGADAAGGGGESMSLADISAAIKSFAPIAAQVAEMQATLGKLANPAAATQTEVDSADKTPAGTEGGEGTPAGTTAAAMDEATFVKRSAKRDRLARQISERVGSFDHSEMTLDQVVAYGVEKLGVKAEKGHEAFALDGFLQAQPVKTPAASVAQDAAIGAAAQAKPNAVTNYISNKRG